MQIIVYLQWQLQHYLYSSNHLVKLLIQILMLIISNICFPRYWFCCIYTYPVPYILIYSEHWLLIFTLVSHCVGYYHNVVFDAIYIARSILYHSYSNFANNGNSVLYYIVYRYFYSVSHGISQTESLSLGFSPRK